uniref:Uncharacterized protein n=1 Tax=Oryza punctata TaxID=4537 RepID=A0A0E0MH56_ORYPU
MPQLGRYGDGGEEDGDDAAVAEEHEWILARTELCTDDAPDIGRDFQSWVRVEYGRNGFVEVEYDVDEFEETQRLQEERRLWRAHVWEKIFADDPPEEGEFAEYVSVYDQEKRAFVMRI